MGLMFDYEVVFLFGIGLWYMVMYFSGYLYVVIEYLCEVFMFVVVVDGIWSVVVLILLSFIV